MGKRVLVAVDFHAVSESSILYGIELAARIESSLALIAVSSSPSSKRSIVSNSSHGAEQNAQDDWMGRAMAEGQRRSVNLEIFVTSGRFFEEVIRFVQSQPAVRFVVMAPPREGSGKEGSRLASALKRLHEEFEGEILLVEKAGQVTRVSDLYPHRSKRETSG